jgi:hypothetical protein
VFLFPNYEIVQLLHIICRHASGKCQLVCNTGDLNRIIDSEILRSKRIPRYDGLQIRLKDFRGLWTKSKLCGDKQNKGKK